MAHVLYKAQGFLYSVISQFSNQDRLITHNPNRTKVP